MSAVDEMLARARAELNRVTPSQADELRTAGALFVDLRPHANRLAEGEIPTLKADLSVWNMKAITGV